MSAVWQVNATGFGVDRICDSLQTGKSVCEDYLACLSREFPVIEDWQDLAVEGGLWVRYLQDGDGTLRQCVERREVDTTGRWFR